MPKLAEAHRFRIEKSTVGDVTTIALHGILDQAFEGKKIGEAVRTKKLILNLRGVRRFASWGMSEWMDFMRATAERDLYLVECSTYAVSQMNLVTGLMGHGKLVSFYTSYRCGHCGEEIETLMLTPVDRAAIRDLANSEQVCGTCKGIARLDKYPATICAAIAERPPFDIDDDVIGLLRSQFKYNLVPDKSRFRAFRRANDGYTYLRLSGNVATLPSDLIARQSQGTTVVDLAGVSYDPNELTAWRTYVQAALSNTASLQLLDCPPGFVEHTLHAEDLNPKLKVRTFAAAYHCLTCQTTLTQMVDVADNLEQLADGTLPPTTCPACKTPLSAYMGHDQSILRRLPAREHDTALDKFLAKVRGEPTDKLEDCLVVRSVKPQAKRSRSGLVAGALAVVVLGGGAAFGVSKWMQNDEQTQATGSGKPVIDPGRPQPPQFQRPDWIMSDTPSSAFCHDMINRLMCVGVSSYRPTRNEAVAEANDTALEELVNAVGLKISNQFFKDTELPAYSDARAKALSALQAADTDRTSAAYAKALDEVRTARKRVVEIFQLSGGAAVPTQRSDWYWEEYAKEKGPGTELLVFVRYDVSLDEVKALVEKYSATTQVMGSSAMTAFPSLAWQQPDFTGGAILTKVASPLTHAPIMPKHIVMSVGDQRVSDATVFAKTMQDWAKATGDLKLTVKPTDGPAKVIDVRR